MKSSQKIWAFIPKKGVTRPSQGARGRPKASRGRRYSICQNKVICNPWDYTVLISSKILQGKTIYLLTPIVIKQRHKGKQNASKRNSKKKLYLSVIKNLQHGSPLGQSRPGFIMRNLIWKEYEALQKNTPRLDL